MNTLFKGISVCVIVLGAALVTLPVQAEEDLPSSGSESADSGVAEELVPEGTVEEEGEKGEITERGVPRIKLKPRPRINIQEKSRPRITIPKKPRKKVSPHQKFRLKPKGEGIARPPIDLRRYVPNQVIVKLRPGMSIQSAMMKKFGL